MKRFLIAVLALIISVSMYAQQQRNADYENYIRQFKPIAVEQMRLHGIPASITLAQGIFESGAGKSELAVNANNHFGIKKGGGWNGPVYTHADDRPDDLFRIYSSAMQSYEDHSKILLRPRYQRLFNLDILDYKSWAKGLKECGYATSPTYASRLVNIIELYELYEIDREVVNGKYDRDAYQQVNRQPVSIPQQSLQRVYTETNGIPCVVALPGDNWDSLARETGISKRKLLKFNEAFEGMPIKNGSFVFLSKKASKGPSYMKHKWHRVTDGDSMYDIAQLYGIRLKNLYKLNFKPADYVPLSGDLIRVR